MTFYVSATCPYTGDIYTDRIRKPNLTQALIYARKHYPYPWTYEIWQHTGATSDV